MANLYTLERAKWTTEKRKQYLKDHPENHAGPNGSFPIEDASDVGDAWGLAGHAENPDAVRAKIKSIAKRLGLESGLPDTAKEDDKERSMPTSAHTHDTLTRAANHDPFTGTHSHPHPADGSQGDDETHEHEHSHDGDADHGHSHAERAADGAIQTSNRPTMYAPFLRIDAAKREVIGQATAEVPDSYKTIFGYYPKAFELWRGNIREQHDPKKAVGRRVDFFTHDDTRSVDLQSRISRGAQDTWLKVEDNVLTGYSLSVIPDPEYGFDTAKWPKKEYNGQMYPYLPRYSIAEVSLVDNPACPGCNIQIVRADGFATDVLDTTEEDTTAPTESIAPSSSSLERAGARVSSTTRDAMHDSIGHTLKAACSQMQNCGCDNCQAAMKTLDPDGDGDIDLGGYGDTDNDAGGQSDDDDMDRAVMAALERALPAAIERALGPVYMRLQGIAGTLARSQSTAPAFEQIIDTALTRALDARMAGLLDKSSLDEVRADLSAVKGQVEKIAETPVPGAPVMHANSLPRPVEKRLPTDPPLQRQRSEGAVYDAIASAWANGHLDTIDKQTNALAAGLVAQRRG